MLPDRASTMPWRHAIGKAMTPFLGSYDRFYWWPVTPLTLVAVAFILASCADKPPEAGAPSPSVAALPPEPPPANVLTGRFVVDAQEYPWQAMGRLNIAGVDFCTGALIGPRTVLVRAHCLYDRRLDRWRPEIDLHYVAGYQRDRYIASAPVRDYQVDTGYDPSRPESLGSVTRNWALVRLEKPLGNTTGWLAVAWGSRHKGAATPILAGYRRDRAHAITLYYGCASAADANCSPTASEQELLRLLAVEEGIVIGGEYYFPSRRALVNALGSENLRADSRGSIGRAPATRSPVNQSTVANLLWQLGYLERTPDKSDRDEVEQAIKAFERERNLPVTGRVTDHLLSQLIEDARRRAG